MSDRQQLDEQIERYAASEMSSLERAAFEQQLETDADLEAALQAHRSMQAAIGDPDRRRLLDVLSELEAPPLALGTSATRSAFFRFWAASALVFAILISAGFWWFYRNAMLPKPVPQKGPAEKEKPIKLTPDSVDDMPAKPIPVQKQIAALNPADFKPNPALDPMVGTQVRGNNAIPEVLAPQNDANYVLQDGQFVVVLKGNVSDAALLEARVFNNKATDFTAAKALQTFVVPVSNGKFNLKKALSLKPGRYYILFYGTGEEEPAAVIRFFVR